jgi:hypothetical protein
MPERNLSRTRPHAPDLDGRSQADKVCLAFLESEIDIGFTFLRLALETPQAGTAHGVLLITKAICAYKSVLNSLRQESLDNVSVEFQSDLRRLQVRNGKLLEAIRTLLLTAGPPTRPFSARTAGAAE